MNYVHGLIFITKITIMSRTLGLEVRNLDFRLSTCEIKPETSTIYHKPLGIMSARRRIYKVIIVCEILNI